MAKAFFSLREVKAKTPQIIYLGFKFGNSQLLYSTGIKILPSQWDFKKSKAKLVALLKVDFIKEIQDFSGRIPTTDELNNFLSSLKSIADNFEIENKESITKESLRAVLDKFYDRKDEIWHFAFDLNNLIQSTIMEAKNKKQRLTKEILIQQIDLFLHPPLKGITLFEYLEKFISDSVSGRRLINGGKVNLRTIQRYKTTETLLKDFKKVYKRQINFEEIDIDFYKDFNAYMAEKRNYTPATMGKHISTMKTFLREATDEGINLNLKFQSKAFKVVETVSDNIALTENELIDMFSLDLSKNQRLERVRDLFIVGANTGLRFSDFTDIQPENIKKDEKGEYIDIIQFKTKERVIVPLNDIALTILKKYNNQFPKAISNQKFNAYLKEVAELTPSLQETETLAIIKGGKSYEESFKRWELVSTHTARRSFATNAYERGVPSLSIMAITGHKTEKSFVGYIKTSKTKHFEMFREHLNKESK